MSSSPVLHRRPHCQSSSTPESSRSNSSVASQVATHYNSIENQGREARKGSPIFNLRKFNNWIKSMLIADTLQAWRSDTGALKPVILDIGFGKGGDLPKYAQGSIKHLIATDIASTSLDQARSRYNEMRLYRNFRAEFFPADSTRDRIRSKFQQPIKANIVCVQFSFHYCFESVEQVKKMLLNISENLEVGGYFIGTTTDSHELIRRARENNSTTFGNDVYKVTFKDDSVLDESKPIPLFGCTYNFTLDKQVVECPEFLVYFPALEEIAKQYGLQLDYCRPFWDLFVEKKYTPEGRDLLDRLRVFTWYRGNNVTNRSGDFDHADVILDDLRRDDSDAVVKTISRSEWEAITLYVAFRFRKVRHVSFQSQPVSQKRARLHE